MNFLRTASLGSNFTGSYKKGVWLNFSRKLLSRNTLWLGYGLRIVSNTDVYSGPSQNDEAL